MNRRIPALLAVLAALAALVALAVLLSPKDGGTNAVGEGAPAAAAAGDAPPPAPPRPVEAPERTSLEAEPAPSARARPPAPGVIVSPASIGCSVVGRVVHAGGDPAALVTVALLGWGSAHALPEGARWVGEPILEDYARTDGAGDFRFDGLPVGLRLRASAILRGTPPASSDVLAPSPGETGRFETIVLGGGGMVSGTVVDASGAPVEAATVAAFPLPPQGEVGDLLPYYEVEGGARTDSQGAFELRGVPPGRFLLVAMGLNLGRAQSDLALPPSGRLDGVLLRLGEGDWIEGTITTTEEEEEVEGAIVRAEPVGVGPRFLVEADDFGDFEFEGVPVGVTYRLTIQAPGFAPATVEPAHAGDDEIEVRLRPLPWIRGEITEEDGSWLPHARFGVFLADEVPPLRDAGPRTLPARADEDGEFVVPVARPGAYRIVAVAPGFAPSTSEVIQVPATGVEEVEISLWTGASIEGTVTGDRRLLPAEVRLYEAAAAGATERNAEGANVPSKGSLLARGRADGRGRFLFSLVPEGRFFLEASHEGLVAARGEPFEVRRRGERRIVKDLALARPASLTGTIEGAGGSGRDLLVAALGPDKEIRSKAPDASGAFRLDGLPPGRHLLLLLPAGRPLADLAWLEESAARRTAIASAEVRLAEAEAGTVTLATERRSGRAVRGLVRRNGLPAEGLAVIGVPADRSDSPPPADAPAATTDAQGRFALEGIEPGAYVFLVRGAAPPRGGNLLLGRFPQVVGEAGDAEVEIGLLSGRLRGRIVGSAGAGIAGIRLLFSPVSSGGAAIDPLLAIARWDANTDAEGGFDGGEAPPGAYRITARAPGHLALERTVLLEAGADSIGEIRLERERDG